MRLADYIVSYSLQINNRCLRFLADSHAKGLAMTADGGLLEGDEILLEVQPVFVESMLVRDSRRLQSMWAWVGADSSRASTHYSELSTTVKELTENIAPTRLALRLASQAIGEDDATQLLMLARALKPHGRVGWGQLSELFSNDSDLWRDSTQFQDVDDDALVARINFNYRKGAKLARRLPDRLVDARKEEVAGVEAQKLQKLIRRQKNYSQASLHQLELLRPGLSDKGKRQLWYLDKLADSHRILSGLTQLRLMIDDTELRKPVVKGTKAYVDEQIEKIYKRIERLSPRAYDQRRKRFERTLDACMANLGLDAVHALRGTTTEDIAVEHTVLKSEQDENGKANDQH